MTLIAVSAAAERLGVSTRQVQHLVAHGELRLVARGVLDEASVDRFLAVRGTGAHSQAWSEPTAWGAIAILSGQVPHWMGGTQRSRPRARLGGCLLPGSSNAHGIVPRLCDTPDIRRVSNECGRRS
jgi:hypothetical protein